MNGDGCAAAAECHGGGTFASRNADPVALAVVGAWCSTGGHALNVDDVVAVTRWEGSAPSRTRYGLRTVRWRRLDCEPCWLERTEREAADLAESQPWVRPEQRLFTVRWQSLDGSGYLPDNSAAAWLARRTCDGCGRTMVVRSDRVDARRYCTPGCAVRRQRQQQKHLRHLTRDGKKCAVCGEEFSAARSDARFCSPPCRQAAYRVRRMTGEVAR